MSTTILLIDLSGIAHMIWHVSASEPDPNATATKTVERVRALASGQPHVAICCDSGRSFRRDVDPTYKAQRPEHDAALQHQITLAMETLRGDGFPVWAAKGYEADDLIATSTAWAMRGTSGETVTIASSDKDLLQLVSDRVTVKSLTNGNVYDETAVLAKFGVEPRQIRDWLSLVGDTSDNVKGAQGIGPKGATKLLTRYGTLEDLYADLDAHGTNFTPALATSLREFQPRMATVRELITLRTDVPLPFDEVFRERVPSDTAVFGDDWASESVSPDGDGHEKGTVVDRETSAPAKPAVSGTNEGTDFKGHSGKPNAAEPPLSATSSVSPVTVEALGTVAGSEPARSHHQAQVVASTVQDAGASAAAASDDRRPAAATVENRGTSLGVDMASGPSRTVMTVLPAPVEFERQLEPRDYAEAKLVAMDMFAARHFPGYGSISGVLSTILIGRELGLSVGASLRGFHIIEGKHAMHADLIRARALASPVCEYFRIVERTNERATFITKRKGDPDPVSLTYTIDDGRLAFGRDESTPAAKQQAEKAWKGSGWAKNPADMCVARASSKLARLVYPDVVHGFYAPEELDS